MSVLRLEGVVKHYQEVGDVVRAVDGVSLSIDPGEVVVLYGPSGSGKTTLLLLAAGLLRPDRGSVLFGGSDLAGMSGKALAAYQRRDLGFIYQSHHLMAGVPAVENAAIKLLADGAAPRRARLAATGWLERVGLAGRLEHPPERLSGGERQRVAIARALVTNPQLILADEPTGSLDSRRGQDVMDLLVQIAGEQRAAVLLVSHDPRAASIATRTYALQDGVLCDLPAPAIALEPGAGIRAGLEESG